MDQAMDISSPNSLLDAEGDDDSSFGETSPEDSTAETQAANALCTMGVVDVRQADEHTSQTMAPCLPEHPAALTALQTGAEEPALSEASRTEASHAMASTLAPEMSEPSYAEAIMISTSEKEHESRDDNQPQTAEESLQLAESPHRVVPATEPEEPTNARETGTQAVTRDLGLRVDSPPIEDDESMAGNDDGHVASAGSSECRADTGTTSAVPYTASRHREASRGRRSVTQGSSDLPISIHGEELSESIIIDDNRGRAIVIDSSDDETDMDDDHSRQNPLPRAQRKRVTPQSPEMVNWTSKDYERRSAASLTAAWMKVWKQWELMNAKADRKLAQILDRFNEKMTNVRRYELWNEEYRKHDGRRVYSFWVTYGIEKRVMAQLRKDRRLVRKFGRALRQLQEEEEEHQSIAVAMDDGDREDCDYQPTRTRHHR